MLDLEAGDQQQSLNAAGRDDVVPPNAASQTRCYINEFNLTKLNLPLRLDSSLPAVPREHSSPGRERRAPKALGRPNHQKTNSRVAHCRCPVIGADGIHSAVRAILFGPDKPRFTKQICWRAMVPIDCVSTQVGLGSGVSVGMFENVQRCFKWGICDRDPLATWIGGRIGLLGDAARPMMPTLAQGAAITMEDAYALARNHARHANNPVAGLKAYDAERVPRASRVQLQAREQFENNRKVPPPPPLDRDWIFVHDAAAAQRTMA